MNCYLNLERLKLRRGSRPMLQCGTGRLGCLKFTSFLESIYSAFL